MADEPSIMDEHKDFLDNLESIVNWSVEHETFVAKTVFSKLDEPIDVNALATDIYKSAVDTYAQSMFKKSFDQLSQTEKENIFNKVVSFETLRNLFHQIMGNSNKLGYQKAQQIIQTYMGQLNNKLQETHEAHLSSVGALSGVEKQTKLLQFLDDKYQFGYKGILDTTPMERQQVIGRAIDTA
jgi:hypothetical protein